MTHVLSAVAWPYANGPRHIGHVAGFGVPSDVFSRYMRMAGHDVLMVSGTDEHGTPILVQAEKEGVTPQAARRPLQPGHRRGPRRPRPLLRPLHPHDHPQPLRGRAGAVPGLLPERLHDRADHASGAISPSTGPHAARPLHRGHLPDLRLRRRPRRPVRQLRQPARPRPSSSTRAAGSTARRPMFVETEHFFLDLPALAEALGAWLQTRTDWRPNVLKFSLNLLDDVRPRAMTRDIDWGIPVPLPGLGGQPRQAALRLVRRRHRLPVGVHRVGPPQRRPRRVARRGGTTRTPAPTTSWARTTSPSTPRSGRPSCSAYDGEGARGGTPGRSGSCSCRPRSSRAST